jgi:[ribosomal protein S5]-alanine N-acetyltransferase
MYTHFQPFPILITPRLKLRQIMLADDKEIFFQRSDVEMNKYVDRPPAKSIDEAREWIEKINKGILADEWIFWGISLRETETLIGGFCFWNLSRENNTAEIGFGLHPEYWGKGLMQEALTEGISFGFETMKLDTIEAYTYPGNMSAVKLLERNNFCLKVTEDSESNAGYSVFTLSGLQV